mgnify:CR=1 FL=1
MLENMIVNELNAAMQMNNSKPYSSKKNSKNDSIEQTEIEMYVFEILNLQLCKHQILTISWGWVASRKIG